jgi:hypothetical protein
MVHRTLKDLFKFILVPFSLALERPVHGVHGVVHRVDDGAMHTQLVCCGVVWCGGEAGEKDVNTGTPLLGSQH